jgi:hypothetical protein
VAAWKTGLASDPIVSRSWCLRLGDDELERGLALLWAPCRTIVFEKIGCAIVFHHFKQALVRGIDVFKLDIEHRVDRVFGHQRAKSILQPEVGKDSAR